MEAINGIHGELANDDKVTVAVVAPAVRAAWGEEFGLSPEFATDRRFVSTLKSVGFDYVFDVDFAADLTIMEESNELLARLQQPDKYSWPMFTSCCPGWVSFAKSQVPAADVRCCHQNLFCTEKWPCTEKYHLCFHHAVYVQEARTDSSGHGQRRNRTRY